MLTLSIKSRARKVLLHFLFFNALTAGLAFNATVVSAQHTDKDKEAIRRRKIKSVTISVYNYQSALPISPRPTE